MPLPEALAQRIRNLNLPWRKPRLEPGPIHLNARRLYILPTRYGALFALLLVGLLIGATNYDISLGFLFTFLLGGVGLVTMLHTQRNLAGLTLNSTPVAPVFAGERAEFNLEITCPGGHERPGLHLATPSIKAEPDDITAQGTLTLRLPQPRRGLRRPGRLTLASTWPLGLFRCWTVFELDWQVLVYPRPAETPLPLPTGHAENAGEHRGGYNGDEFDSLRPYQPGDGLRRIAWKSLARGQALATKQFTSHHAGHLWLSLEAAPERDLEARLSRLTRWALEADASGQPWGLELAGQRIPPNTGEAHLKRCLNALACFGDAA